MSAIIRDSFRVRTLQNFISSLSSNSLYLGIGRPEYWDTVGSLDTNIPTPKNNVVSVAQDWDDMMSLKKLTPAMTSAAIFNEPWVSNTIYDQYRHDWDGSKNSVYNGSSSNVIKPASIGDVKCFVTTSSYNTYICIAQGIISGIVQPSTFSPDTGSVIGSTGMVSTADGYIWLFVASTSASDHVSFSNSFCQPIKTLLTAPITSDAYYPQWLSQQLGASYKGGIYQIGVTTSGSGYNGGVSGFHTVTNAIIDTQFTITGDGIGLQFDVAYAAGGGILSVSVTNPGSGYSYAKITAIGGTGATFDVIFTPMSGITCDPVLTCVARYLVVSTTLTDTEGGFFTVKNDYRKISIILNPTDFGSAVLTTAAGASAMYSMNVGTGLISGSYNPDDIISGTTSQAAGRVVDFDYLTGTLRYIKTPLENFNNPFAANSFQINDTVTNVTTATSNGIIVSITNPDVQPYSGDIIYTEYRSPVMRNPAQTENISVVLKF